MGNLLNIHSERLSENVLAAALNEAVKDMGHDVCLVDYTACENTHYEVVTGNTGFFSCLQSIHRAPRMPLTPCDIVK